MDAERGPAFIYSVFISAGFYTYRQAKQRALAVDELVK